MHAVFAFVFLLFAARPAFAQIVAQPTPPIWTVLASAGLAFTSGNTDTSTVNAAYDITYDPKTKNIVKSDALLLRGKTQGLLSTNRLGLNVRDEYRIGGRAFVFGQNQYLRDEFKSIDYLNAPTAGLGYRLLDTERSKLGFDAGVGGVWEKNTGLELDASGAISVGEKLSQTITGTTTVTQAFTGLWKTDDMADALYTFSAGVAAAMSTRTQLKIELLDVYKNKPPVPGVLKNDVALVMAIVFKM